MSLRYAIERQTDGMGPWEALGADSWATVAEAKAKLYEAQTCENGKGDGDQYRMVEIGREGDLYRDAVAFGFEQAAEGEAIGAISDEGDTRTDARGYWIAWFAARQAVKVLLAEARRVGCTNDQVECLRAVAADVAYD